MSACHSVHFSFHKVKMSSGGDGLKTAKQKEDALDS